MGACASRPKDEEISKHKKYSDHVHDHKFKYITLFPFLNEIKPGNIKTADEQDKYKEWVTKLEYEIPNIRKKLDSTKKLLATTSSKQPVLLVEVQKAQDITPDLICIQKAQSYVQIELLPNGPKDKTSESSPFIPIWYHLSTFKRDNLEKFDHLKLTVYHSRKIGPPLEFGTVTINMNDLKNQEVYEAWHDIATIETTEEKPMIRLRIQFLHDNFEFMNKEIDIYEQLLPMANEALRKCKEKLNKLDLEIPPEGRGDLTY